MDIDQLSRALKDLEYRVKLLEKAQDTTARRIRDEATALAGEIIKLTAKPQFCSCGRDICRAPDCPSHKPDPMGR